MADNLQPSVLSISERYGVGIVLRRSIGCMLDSAFVLAVLATLQHSLGDAYQKIGSEIWLLLAVLYFPFCEATWGRTLGKLLVGTVVVREDGEKPTTLQALVRGVCLLVEVIPLFPMLMTFMRHKQRMGDLLAGTYVLRHYDYQVMKSWQKVDFSKPIRREPTI